MLSDREISLALNLQISIYLHRRHQHPHCDDSCEIQSLGAGTRSALIRCRSKRHRPTRWAHCPVQNVHFVVLTGPCHNPAVCTPPEHQPDPSGHHTPSPNVHGGRSLLCQSRSCFLHWPGGPVPRLFCCCPQLLFQRCQMWALQRWRSEILDQVWLVNLWCGALLLFERCLSVLDQEWSKELQRLFCSPLLTMKNISVQQWVFVQCNLNRWMD